MKAEWMDQFSSAIEALDLHNALSLVQNKHVDAKELMAFYEYVIQPLLIEIDTLEGDDNIFKEHARTQIIMNAICHFEASIFEGQHLNGPNRSNYKILMYSPEGEHHILGLRMMQDLIEINGFNTFFAGADMPNHQLRHILEYYRPSHVIASITNSYHLIKFKEAVGLIRASLGGTLIIGTGRAFIANPTAIPEVLIKSDFREILKVLGVSL